LSVPKEQNGDLEVLTKKQNNTRATAHGGEIAFFVLQNMNNLTIA